MALAALLRTLLRRDSTDVPAPVTAAFTFYARARRGDFRAPARQSAFTARRRQTTFYAVRERD